MDIKNPQPTRCQVDLLNSQQEKVVFFQSNLMKGYELALTGTASDMSSRWKGTTMVSVSKSEDQGPAAAGLSAFVVKE